MTERVDELLEALRLHREEYIQGKLDSLTWIKARRLIMKEAEILKLTDEMIERAGEEA